MKQWMKIAVCIALVCMVGFSAIGYAALTDTLRITGSAEVEIPYGLFITNIKTIGTNNIDKNEFTYLQYSTTVESTISHVKASKGQEQKSGSVTYSITVFNNTDLTYAYRGLYYQKNLSGYDGNDKVSTTNGNGSLGIVCSLDTATPANKIVRPGQSLTFTVTYTLGKDLKADTNWKTMINYQFGINVEGEAQAIEIVENKFLDILNNQVTYDQLIDVLDNKYDGSNGWKSNYIGNVKGSTSNDSVAVNSLFAGQLQITVGNNQLDATVLIKHENLDNNTLTGDDYVAYPPKSGGNPFYGYGCEMTLYLTVNPLKEEDAWQYVPVYAVVFTRNRDEYGNFIGDWYRIGDTYAGEADVVTYEGNTGGGSFCTDRWRSYSTTYSVVEGYRYTVGGQVYQLNSYSYQTGYQEGIKSIVTTKDANATRTMQTLLDHAKAIISSQDFAGTGIELVEQAYADAARYYTLDANGNPVVTSTLTRAQLCPAMKELRYAVDTALKQMEALEKEQNGQ